MHTRSCMLVIEADPILTTADIPQNVVGMSVVGPDFEKLRRFNIEELRTPLAEDKTSKSQTKAPEKE
jgi:tRNA acetyltransferase TAN1